MQKMMNQKPPLHHQFTRNNSYRCTFRLPSLSTPSDTTGTSSSAPLLQANHMEQIDTMTGVEFEELLLAHFRNLGYTGQMTPHNDYGADLILEKARRKVVVQAKRWKHAVGIFAVQQVIGAIKYYGASKGMVVTNSVFTLNAYELAQANGIELVDRERLSNMLTSSHRRERGYER